MSNREDLEKQAQEKLTQAWALIREAGALAKEGQFHLHFGEVGDFIPSLIDDRDKLRERALEILKKNGKSEGGHWEDFEEKYPSGLPKSVWVPNPSIPFDDLTPEQVEEEIEQVIDEIIDDMGIPYEAREYGERDTWWAPSRC